MKIKGIKIYISIGLLMQGVGAWATPTPQSEGISLLVTVSEINGDNYGTQAAGLQSANVTWMMRQEVFDSPELNEIEVKKTKLLLDEDEKNSGGR